MQKTTLWLEDAVAAAAFIALLALAPLPMWLEKPGAEMNHPDWHARLAEAYCVENGIPCTRKFSDAELEAALAEVRIAKAQLYSSPAMRDRIERHEGSNTQYRSGGIGGYEMNTRGGILEPGR